MGTLFYNSDFVLQMQPYAKIKKQIRLASLLAIVSFCFFAYALHYESGIFREFQAALLSVEWMLEFCIAIWCGSFIFLTFRLNDLPLIGLLLIAIAAYFIGYAAASRAPDVIILLAGVTLGRGVRVLLVADSRWQMVDGGNRSEIGNFLVGLVVLLTFSSCWHLDVAHNSYPGTRWTGLWYNPNIYGMLMGAGAVLAIGLLAASPKPKVQSPKSAESAEGIVSSAAPDTARGARALPIFLSIAAGMMGVGLVMSYSRGAWVGTAVGLLYLANAHGKLKWRLVLPGILLVAAVVVLFWHSTSDTDQWYFKRLDLSRPSAQHRVSAWRGAVQMMWDHPLGVGWNKVMEIYEEYYSPPKNGAAAITTNDYLMLGTQLGLPGLLCFVAYVGLRLGVGRWKLEVGEKAESGKRKAEIAEVDWLQTTCCAGAIVLLVGFWFDGGLFKLATASTFWVLLELGRQDLTMGRTK